MCSSGNLSDKGWALSPRDLVRQSTTGTCADAVCELGAFPRHLLNQNIFKGRATTKPLLLVTKSSTRWLRHKEASCYLYKYLNSPSLASTLLLALLIRRSNSKTCLPALFGFCVEIFTGSDEYVKFYTGIPQARWKPCAYTSPHNLGQWHYLIGKCFPANSFAKCFSTAVKLLGYSTLIYETEDYVG